MVTDYWEVSNWLIQFKDKRFQDSSLLQHRKDIWRHQTTALYLRAECLGDSDDYEMLWTQVMIRQIQKKKSLIAGSRHLVYGGAQGDGTNEAIRSSLESMKTMVATAQQMVEIMYREDDIQNNCFWNLISWDEADEIKKSGQREEYKSCCQRLLKNRKSICDRWAIADSKNAFLLLKDNALEVFQSEKNSPDSKWDLFQHNIWRETFFKHQPRHASLEPLREELCLKTISIRSTTENECLLKDASSVWKSARGGNVNFENLQDIVQLKRYGPQSLQELAVATKTNAGVIVTPNDFMIELHHCFVETFGKHFRTCLSQQKGTLRAKRAPNVH